jgi:glycine hydroxymethyltransferase
MYDAAHVLGLIAGGEFQHPFEEGADIITGSTHKTLPGPQGGIILAKNPDEKLVNRIQAKVFPGLVSNHHLHHIPALGITLLEMLAFGKEYASHTVSNAQAFAKALDDTGFSVVHKVRGGKKVFSESHQVLLDVRPQGKGRLVAESLEQANVITNKQMLAFDDVNNPADPSGLRLGVQEMTRFGMTEKDMGRIADFFRRVLVEKENPERVRNDVIQMRSEFQSVNYCFKE